MGIVFRAALVFENPRHEDHSCPCAGKMFNTQCEICMGCGYDIRSYDAAYTKLSPGEISLNGGNACQLLKTLDLDDPEGLWGDVQPTILRQRIAAARTKELKQYARPDYDNHGIELTAEGISVRARFISLGLQESRFERYFERLENLCTIAEQAGVKIVWN